MKKRKERKNTLLFIYVLVIVIVVFGIYLLTLYNRAVKNLDTSPGSQIESIKK